MQPEQYVLKPNSIIPNNDLPALVYRNVLPRPINEDSTTEFLERHAWEKRGTFGAIKTAHFHPNTHECYGIFRGTSTLLFGTVTPDSQGTTVSVKPGDVVVVPSGVAHSSVEASDDYAYIGVYPVDAPRWRNEFGKTPVHDPAMQRELEEVKIPGKCPVEGSEGALVKIWNERRGKAKL